MQRFGILRNLSRFAAWAALLAAVCPAPAQPAPAGIAPEARPPAPRRPSIILIMADDLGYGDLGCYGQTRIRTPNIDQLAAEGIRFTDFYAGGTVCTPSRAALMLGRHTGHLNLRRNFRGSTLLDEEITVAQVLKQSGYRTGLIGKWGLAHEGAPGVPQKKGFDEFLGYLDNTHAHDYYADYLWRYDPPRAGHSGYDAGMPFPANRGGRRGEYIPDLCTFAALNFIKNNKPDQFNKYRPFFLFLSYTIPHANNEEGRRTGNGMQVPDDAPYSNESWPQPEKNKAAMITRMDADIGRLLNQLKELKLEENTVVFFTSDNGPHKEGGVDPKFLNSAGRLRGMKRDLYEGGIRVPMIVRWPARIKPGQVSDFVWANWDFLPTAADIAMIEPPKDLDGFSVLPLLTGREQTNRHDFLYWEFHERGFQQAARMGEWKALRPQAGEDLELYHLARDLAEKENVAEKHPEVVEKFEEYFKTARSESPRWPVRRPEGLEEKEKPGSPGPRTTPPGK